MDPITPPALADIRAAALANRSAIIETPVVPWQGTELASRVGETTEVILKLELFQHAGSFKPRGALCVMRAMDPEARSRGVTAVSAGNHAIATAYAARLLGLTAKVVMLASASPYRVARARSFGAEVLLAPSGAEAFGLAERLASEEGRTFVHPFEGPLTALGTATLGVEFNDQAGELDAIIVPIGGGGLCAGVSSAFRTLQPRCAIYGVEPLGADTMNRSFVAGSPQCRDDVATIADSLAPPYALPYSFSLCRQNLDRLVQVGDHEIIVAMALLAREMKLAVEPAAAAATAALLGPLRDELRGKRVGIVICGANIDHMRFAELVAAAGDA